ncbi:MAG: ring-cleaving dioxygenase [Verrucomicrobia bacterium]|nr:ring-cleaving dioxygenase [Verrucomicrobiota bacterium]
MNLLGLHHITAMAGDPVANVAFYTRVLGLRLIKRTVNFDDPSTYHLYFGDTVGTPGSALTFFYWAGQPRGRIGSDQVTATAWSVPAASLDFWTARLTAHHLPFTTEARFGDQVLRFADPDGLGLEIVATREPDPRQPWSHPDIPIAHGLRGFHSVTLTHAASARTAALLVSTMGARETTRDETTRRARYALAQGVPGTCLDLLTLPDGPRGQPGLGTVHHVAFRVADDEAELAARSEWQTAGLNVSPQMDRNYFHSIYAREPGGILFEIATDTPGFAIDEPLETLGTTLKLPARYEPHRAAIEATLPPLPA